MKFLRLNIIHPLFLIICLCKVININAQNCSLQITNLNDTIDVCKNTIYNQLNPTVNGSVLYTDTTWSPAIGLSDPNISNPTVNIGTVNVQYSLVVQAVSNVELLQNGDFSQGNTLFTTSYVPGTGGTFGLLSQEGQYAITTNPSLVHTNFASFPDHTTGTGQMMVVNGAGTPNVNVWCQTITVQPNTLYDFSAWGATCVPSNPAILQFSINGGLLGTPLALPVTTGQWTQFHTTWFSGTNTSITICVTNQAVALSGNDFAIDDISFRQICADTASVYFRVTDVIADFTNVTNLGCIDDTITFTNTSTSTIGVPTYVWSFGDGTFSTATDTTKVYFNQGVYNVTLIASDNGCQDTVNKSIDLNHPIDALFRIHDGTIPTPGVVDSFCLGETVHLDAQASVPQGFLSYAWDFGDGQTQTTLANSVTHVYSAPGVYTIRLVVTDTLGCIDSVSHGVFIDNPPYVNFTMSDDKVCVGEPIQFTDTVAPFTKSIIWNFGDGSSIIDVHNPSHSWSAAGTPYSVSLTGTYNICPDRTVTKDVYVYNYPSVNLGPDTSICPGVTGAIQLANLAGGGGSYQWSTGETASSILVTQPGYYWLQATEPNAGCISADTIWVKRDCYVNIPNSFSPNGDGLNDYFLPRNLLSSGLRTFTMNIYNRWGEKIFYTTSIDGRGWDGKFGGVVQPQGVFVYTIDVEFQNGMKKNYKGNVTLMR